MRLHTSRRTVRAAMSNTTVVRTAVSHKAVSRAAVSYTAVRNTTNTTITSQLGVTQL